MWPHMDPYKPSMDPYGPIRARLGLILIGETFRKFALFETCGFYLAKPPFFFKYVSLERFHPLLGRIRIRWYPMPSRLSQTKPWRRRAFWWTRRGLSTCIFPNQWRCSFRWWREVYIWIVLWWVFFGILKFQHIFLIIEYLLYYIMVCLST